MDEQDGEVYRIEVGEERAEQARAARVELEGLLWRAETPGLARADLQSWLRRKQHYLKLDALQAQVENPEKVSALESVWEVKGQLRGNLTISQVIQLLESLELNPQQLRIRELRAHRRGPLTNLELVFIAHYIVPAREQDE